MKIFTELLQAFNLAKIGGKTDVISPDILTTATPYTTGQSVSTIIKIADAIKTYNSTGILKSIHVKDSANQKQPLTILIFSADPTLVTGSNPTAATVQPNVAFAYGTSLPLQIAKVNVLTSDYETIAGVGVADIDTIAKGVKTTYSKGLDLFAVVITTGTPTYAATTTSLNITYTFLQD